MPSKRLTKLVIERTRPPESGRLEIRDTAQPGFGVRVTEKGVRSFFVVYRIKGDATRRQRRWTIGPASAWELDEAREEARRIIALAQRGVDPVEDAAEKEAARKRAQTDTFGQLRKRYIADYQMPNRRAWRQVDWSLKKYCSHWDDTPTRDIRKGDVQELIDEIARDRPVTANRVLSHLKHLFRWADRRDLVRSNPAAGVDKPLREKPRKRVLTADEIRRIWKAADSVGWPYGEIVKLLFLVGQRVKEVGRMRWCDLSDDRTVWTLPPELSKTDTENIVPLSPKAQEIVRGLPAVGRRPEWVFQSGKRTPVSAWSAAKRKLDHLSGVTDWQLRDIRRTVATNLAEAKVDRFIIELVLAHTIRGTALSGVERDYNTWAYVQEKRDALERWADRLALILSDDPGRVVALPVRE